MKRKPAIDPEQQRWNRKYPSFPGVGKCIELLQSPNVRGMWIDIICGLLAEHSTESLDELFEALSIESNARVRNLILKAIAASKSPRVVPFLAGCLESPDIEMSELAAIELKAINDREARRALFNHERK